MVRVAHPVHPSGRLSWRTSGGRFRTGSGLTAPVMPAAGRSIGGHRRRPQGHAVRHERGSALAGELTAAGWVVVSGAAFGIDSAAHRGALTAGGCTVAVLPEGSTWRPHGAHGLSRDHDHGVLISEQLRGRTPSGTRSCSAID